MDGRNQNQQGMQGYAMNFNEQQQAFEQQYRLIAQQQYINNLGVSSIYNNPHLISQSVDMQNQLRQQQLLQAALSQQQQMQYIGQNFVDHSQLQQPHLSNTMNAYQQQSLVQPVAQHMANSSDLYRQTNISVQNPLILQQQQQRQHQAMPTTLQQHSLVQPQPQHVPPRSVQTQPNQLQSNLQQQPMHQHHLSQQQRSQAPQPEPPPQQHTQPLQQANRNQAYQPTESGKTKSESTNLQQQQHMASLQQQQSAALNASVQNKILLKQKEEAAEAERRERERRERERVEEEVRRHREEAQEFAKDLNERISSFPQPLHFANCHTLTKVSAIVPLPSECLTTSINLTCFDPSKAADILNTTDSMLAQMLSDCLNDCYDDIRDIELKHEGDETSELDVSKFPPLIQTICGFNESALNIDPTTDPLTMDGFILNDHEINMAIAHDFNDVVNQVSGHIDDHSRDNHLYQESSLETETAQVSVNDTYQNKQEKDESVDVSALVAHQTREQAQLRKQMVSVGKQPKAAPNRRKRDMVEALYDSLTGYFDPSTNRRSRRNKNYEDETNEKNDMELRESPENEENNAASENELPSTSIDEHEPKFFDRGTKRGRKRQRRDSEAEINRPSTPTEDIQRSHQEWMEKRRLKEEINLRRKTETDADWNNDVAAEIESQEKFRHLIDQIFEQVEDIDVLQSDEPFTDRIQVEELLIEAKKLKAWRKINKFNIDRLIKLLTMLERCISEVLSEDGSLNTSYIASETDDESDETYRELMNERLIRAADGACCALIIMTAPRMPKQVLLEDTIERAVQMCKQFLQHIVYPSSDIVCRGGNKTKKALDDRTKRRKSAYDNSATSSTLADRMSELVECFSELVRFHTINETVVIQLCTLASGPFFVDNVSNLQIKAIKLLSTIFSRYPDMRKSILQDLLNSLHRLPPMKNQKNCYRIGNESIQNFTVLILQLVQSVVKLPNLKKLHEDDDRNDVLPEDTIVIESYEDAQKMTAFFLSGFLNKCTAKSEDDYRRMFDQFLKDLLVALYRPEWPVSEMVLTVLGGLLCRYYRPTGNMKIDISLRVASLDYLGTIAARLRRDRIDSMQEVNANAEKQILESVVKRIIYDELGDPTKTLDDIDTSNLSMSEKMRKLEQALIDYIIGSQGNGEVSVEYAIMFYVGEWYKETVEDMEMAKERHRQAMKDKDGGKDLKKLEKKLNRLLEKGEIMKNFVLTLADKKHLKKRHQYLVKTHNIMIDRDANWTVRFLASKREFSQSFNNFLKMILYGVQLEPAVQLRTKAMKCLTQIIEADHEVLLLPEVQAAVSARMTDTNVLVRDATIELLGKYLIIRPDFLNKYYTILMDRIKDTGVAVRKRVIRILRDIVENQPDNDKVPEMLARIIRRINDEEGIKKLCIETFQNLWFVPVNERSSSDLLLKKVTTMADTAEVAVSENMSEYFETLVSAILKNSSDKSALYACRQIVDCLIDNILTLDSKVADEAQKLEASKNGETKNSVTRTSLGRLLASLTTLSAFCKIRPELMVKHAEVLLPYLSTISSSSPSELQVLNQVINMLELIVPLMDHPSDIFLNTLDERLGFLIKDKGMVIIASAVACMSASYKKWKKPKPAICEIFLSYLRYLSNAKTKIESTPGYKLPDAKKPTLMRCLYTLGLSNRYFDFDKILNDDEDARNHAKNLGSALKKLSPIDNDDSNSDDENRLFCNLVYAILLYFSRSNDPGIRLKSLTALGNMTAEHTDFLTRKEIKNMYNFCLQAEEPGYLPNKIQVLKNLSMFLQSEEQKAIKTNEQLQKQKKEGGEDISLKDMELSVSGLSASIIQVYWNSVLNCYFHAQDEVRISTVQVVWQTLQQGLVTPGSSIPTLISMSTDVLPNIRSRTESLLKEIDTKYNGMVPSKSVNGVRLSFKLQKVIRKSPNNLIRGIRACEHSTSQPDQQGLPKSVNEAQAILSGLYSMLRSNRQQRRSFLSALLRLFSENSTEKLSLEEWIFVADNLAMFPYTVLDEPLYVINQAELITSTTGQDILAGIKNLLLPRRHSHSVDDEDDEFTSEMIYRRLPEDKSKIYDLMRQSHCCFLLLYLKTFLMRLYGFNESKIQEYSPSESAKVYEKPVARKNVSIFNPEMTLRELSPDVIAKNNTIEGHINLSQQIVYFRNMLLSLEKLNDDEEEEDEEMEQERSLLEKTPLNNSTEPMEDV